jgi:hypothetical protein
MHKGLRSAVVLLSFAIASFLFTSSANAQCNPNTSAFDSVGLITGNPFQAEKVITRSGSPQFQPVNENPRPEPIARDSQGRVRIEHVTGKFKHDNGAEAGTEEAAHLITICDPAAQTITHIDTLNKTAEIRHSRPASQNLSRAPRPFCALRLAPRSPNMQVESLGHQIIEGVDAEGSRITMRPLGAPDAGESIREIWCSEELAVVVQENTSNTKSEMKTSLTLTNLVRQEPDPSLFQIPEGYSVTESVPDLEHSRPAGTPARP